MSTYQGIENFKSEDIGPKIISYMAEGLYPDARDPIREYIQNAVDAKATEVALEISEDSITIENNGEGMDASDLRRLLRIAISDKDPRKNVGYKGIGIYSGLLISQQLIIKSKKSGICAQLQLDFEKMRDLVKVAESVPDVINATAAVESVENFEFHDEAMVGDGTQVTLIGIRKEFREFYERDELSKYLTNTMPLSFNSKLFCFADDIDTKIREICESPNYVYHTVPIHLTINGQRNTLYSPYQFEKGTVLEPQFKFIKLPVNGEDTVFALVWGCLNKERKMLPKHLHRGFIIKQKGFTIGNTSTAQRYFASGVKFANRYIGEIIIFSHHLKPNTARSDLAHTEHFPEFKRRLEEIATGYEKKANAHQENTIALEECDRIDALLIAVTKSPTQKDISDLRQQIEKLKNRLKKPLRKKTKKRINKVLKQLNRELPKLEKKLTNTKNGDQNGSTSSDETSTNGDKEENVHEKGGSEKSDQNGSTSSDETSTNGDKEENGGEKGGSERGTGNRGILENAEVKKILDELNKSGRRSNPSARKLKQLYNSLCTISIEQHSCLGYIGTWALWETIGAVLKAKPKHKAWDYLTQSMSNKYKKFDPQKYSNMEKALRHILDHGNANKHSATSLGEDGSTLYNYMENLDDFLLDMIEEVYEHLIGAPWRTNTPPDNS